METDQKSNGAIIGIVVIIILLILGGFLAWKNAEDQKIEREINQTELEGILNSENIDTELDAIDQDLNSLNTDINVDIDALE